MQLPFHLILLSIDCNVPCTLVDRDTLTRIAGCTMTSEVSGMCVLATLFAIFYMMLTSSDDDDAFASTYTWLTSGPDTNDEGSVLLELIRLAFWCFAWFQGLALTGGLLGRVTFAELLLANVARLAPLWALCRTNSDSKGRLWRGATGGACACWYVAMVATCLKEGALSHALPLLAQATCDMLLALGHTWDQSPTTMLVMHCRLFFVAASATLTQLLSVLSIQ